MVLMGFRKSWNRHENWLRLLREQADLLLDVPRAAVASESAFRDYVTRGAHRGARFSPSVFDLSPEALKKLATFVDRAQFDMDAMLFDDFNEALRRSRRPEQGEPDKQVGMPEGSQIRSHRRRLSRR